MKRTIKLAVSAAMVLSATSAFATNGDHLIGMGAKARGMGGTGIGISHGAETAISNAAMISSVEGTEISFGGTVFMPDVQTDMGMGGGSLSSDADLSVIPEVAIAQKVNENFYWGIGMYGVAGMGVDYRDELSTYNGDTTFANAGAAMAAVYTAAGVGQGVDATVDQNAAAAFQGTVYQALGSGNFAMVTNLQLMQFAIPLTYKRDGFSVGVAPVLQYGSLDINYNLAAMADTTGDGSANTAQLISGSTQGVAQDLGFGYNVGIGYEMDGLTVGASYRSSIDMEYKGQISKAAADFSQGTLVLSDNLEQPAEMGVGISYETAGHTVAIEAKQIKWESAKGYKDFGWTNQNVYMIGYQFEEKEWAVRLGYNYAESAVEKSQNTLLNTLNLLGFPATVESHYTLGGSYNLSEKVSLDLAYAMASEKTDAYANMLQSTTTTKHSQSSLSFQLNFNF